MKPVIDPDFSALIPPLSQEEYNQLEQNILKEGIRHNLVVWEGILLDGHNRLRIALKHGLPYGVDTIQLDSREDAQAWMVDNQLGRRNLTPAQRDYLLGIRYRQEKKQGARTDLTSGQNDQRLDTAESIGRLHGVSEVTVRRRVSLGMAYTKDIFACIEQGLCYTQQTGSQQKGQARFYVVKWDDMKNKGYKLCELDYLVDSQKRA